MTGDSAKTSQAHNFRCRRSAWSVILLSFVIVLSLSVNYRITRVLVQTTYFSKENVSTPNYKITSSKRLGDDELEKIFLKKSHNQASTDPTRGKGYRGKIVDVLSIASKKRPEYMKAQQETWARHPLVRNFVVVTEELDGGDLCQKVPEEQALTVSRWCRKRYLNTDPHSPDFSWIMQRFTQYFARKAWLMNKPNPVGWLCAQKRFPIGLARTILGYKKRGEPLPDYLLVVDDDTFYNMDLYYKELIASRESSDPFVGAGCRITNGKDKVSGVVFPFGGFGLTFSKGSIERLLLPLSRKDTLGNDEWQNSTLAMINQNLIFERESFTDGMNLAEMMESFAIAEPFHNISGWTRGYCFHGHWVLAIFTQLYGLHSEYFMEALQNSEITLRNSKRGPRYTNLCKNEYGECKPTDLVCHYQTPLDMHRLMSGVMGNSATGYDVTNKIIDSTNNTAKTKPPIIVLKTRFMQFQSNLTSLGKARLQLFETFCLPTIVGQVDHDFLWLIRTDPALDEKLLLSLKNMMKPYRNRFFLIASNDNTEAFRQLDVNSMDILSGDRKALQRIVDESHDRWLVETRLDADDGLHKDMIGAIREAATSYMKANAPRLEWRVFCVSSSLNWHSGALSPVSKFNPNVTDTTNIPPEGIITHSKRQHKSCITPGLSYVLPPHLASPPIIGHHLVHEKVPPCDESHDSSGTKCLKMLDLDFYQAIQARTPTSHGMGGFHKEYKQPSDSEKLWTILSSSFSIVKNGTQAVIENFRENVINIAKDNLAGQCTEDHSCSHFTRRYLERVIWNKEREFNITED